MADQIIKYTANDGVEVQLSRATIAAYIATGNAEIEPKDAVRFMSICRARGLNPLAGDAHLNVFSGKGGKSVSVIVSKDYFMRTATQNPAFNGLKAGIIVIDAKGQVNYREGSFKLDTETLVGGWAEVSIKDRAVPSRAEVSLAEYDQGRSIWLSKPATMIRKVAVVQALREAFPAQFRALYDADEMPTQEMNPVPDAVAEAEPAHAPQPAPAQEVEATVTAAEIDAEEW